MGRYVWRDAVTWIRVRLCSIGGRCDDLQRAAFLAAIHLSPTSLFQFNDRNLELNYLASHGLADTRLRSVQILVVWIFYASCWIVSTYAFYSVRSQLPDDHLRLITETIRISAICGIGFVSFMCAALLLICRIRRHEIKRVQRAFANLVNGETPADIDCHKVSVDFRSPRIKGQGTPHRENITHFSASYETATKEPKLPTEQSEEGCCRKQQSAKMDRKWKFLATRWFVDICCSEHVLVVLLSLASIDIILWQTCGILALEHWPSEEIYGFSRLTIAGFTDKRHPAHAMTRCTLYLIIIISNWSILTCGMSTRSLYLSSKKCVLICVLQIFAFIVPFVTGLTSSLFAPDEFLACFISLMIVAYTFFNKFRVDFSNRMIFYFLWKTSDEELPPTRKTNSKIRLQTGMEDVLLLLDDISSLAAKASATTPGSLICSDHLLRILVKTHDAQGMLLKQQDLYRVRVKDQGEDLDFARMYGMEIGQASIEKRDALPPIMTNRFGTMRFDKETLMKLADESTLTNRLDSGPANGAMYTNSEMTGVKAQLSRFQSSLVSPRRHKIEEAVARHHKLVPSFLDTHSTDWTGPTSSSRSTRSTSLDSLELKTLGGFRPDELPRRQLAKDLTGVVGCIWTIDLFQLNEQCEGNILLEVGYALLGQKLTCMLHTFPKLLDRAILDAFKSETDLQFGCFEHFTLISFLYGLQQQYRTLPYHNAVHAALVAHSCACLTNYLALASGSSFTPAIEVAATLAALGHDVGHPGRNNHFFINSYDPLSVIYNDTSILENYHSCLLFMTLELENCNILFPFNTEVFRQVRQMIIKLILATDMKCHYEHCSRFKLRCSDRDFNPYINENDLTLVLEMCMKAADLGASVCEWDVHQEWCFRVVEEFYRQGEEETKLGLPISPLCDRAKHDSEFAKSQASFIEFVTAPMFKDILAFDPSNFQIKNLTTTVEANKAYWRRLIDTDQDIPSRIRYLDSSPRIIQTPRKSWKSVVGDLKGSTPVVGTAVKKFELDDRKSIRRSKAFTMPMEQPTSETAEDSASFPSDSFPSDSDDPSTLCIESVYTESISLNTKDKYVSGSRNSTVNFRTSATQYPFYSEYEFGDDLARSNSMKRESPFVNKSFRRRVDMPRDYALSPSARLGFLRSLSNDSFSVVNEIRRRASVLTPNSVGP